MGAMGRRDIGDSNRDNDPHDRDAPDARPADPPHNDAAPAARAAPVAPVAPAAPVRRTGGDLTRDLEQVGADLSPSEEAALIANRWQR